MAQGDPFAQYVTQGGDPFAAYATSQVKPIAADEPDTYAGGFIRSLKQQGGELARAGLDALPAIGGIVGGVVGGGTSAGLAAVPAIALGAGVGKGARDLIGHATGLDAPTTPMEKAGGITKDVAITGATAAILPGVVEAAKTPLRTAGELGEQFGKMLPQSVRRLGNVFPSAVKSEAAPILERPAWQTWPQEAPVDLSSPVKAGSLTQDEIAARIAAVRANGGLPAGAQSTPVRGVIRTTAQPAIGAQPAQAAAETVAPAEVAAAEGVAMPESWKPFAAVKTPPSLREPRVQIGAEKVGRTAGLTKEEVRQQVGPLMGEELGEASPILPQEPLKRIIDTMKGMAPADREAYVAKATAGKTRGQVENIRRTLEHLGLLVAAPVAAGMSLRDALMQRMNGGTTPGATVQQ